jgi:hypothetical protein
LALSKEWKRNGAEVEMALLGNFDQELGALLEGNILQEIRQNNPGMSLQQAADRAMEIANDIRDQFDEDEIEIIVANMIQGLGLDAAIDALNEIGDLDDFVGIDEDDEEETVVGEAEEIRDEMDTDDSE